jgi:hypothetical protein
MISVNHGAKGIVMWDYPSELGIYEVTAALSKVLGSEVVGRFLLNSFVVGTLPVVGSIRNPESLPSTCRLGKLQRRANIHRYANFTR